MSQDVIRRGKYIVVDGIDGGGKTTLFGSLKEEFPFLGDVDKGTNSNSAKNGYEFIYTREPGGTPLGESLRPLILSEPMDRFSEMCLFMAQRKEVRVMLEPYLNRGTHVISDRSESASFAYQIRGRRLQHLENIFWEMNRNLAPFPTMYIFLDIPPSIAFERLNNRGENVTRDVFEKEKIEYFEKVRKGFLEFPSKVKTSCIFVCATNSKERVASEVIVHIKQHISL